MKKAEEEYWVFESGKLVEPSKWKGKNELFKILVDKEALKKELPGGEPEFIKPMKRFGIDWEPMSDLGHMRYGPLGSFIFEIISKYSKQVAESVGVPVFHVRGTNMFNLNEKAIREHAKLFNDRLYEVDVDKKRFVLRYAACFQQFALIKDWNISYKNLPLGVLEIADSYRLEQSGELLLSFRVRKMTMPDMHVLCKDLEQSKEICLKLHKKIYEEFGKLDHDLVCLYNLTKSFYDNNQDFFEELEKIEKKPLLLRFVPEEKYYWVVNVEHHIIDKMKRPREIATWQIDVGNAERFDIKFTDKDNRQKRPVIIHTAILGTIERYIYSAFDSAIRQKNPLLPLWLSPIQARLCPMNDSLVKYCEELLKKIEKDKIRVDLDDRVESVEKKVRDAEMEWIPFIIVIGEREKKSGKLAVRLRETGKVENIEIQKLIDIINKETKDFPFKHLPLPRHLSKRPSFI